MANDWTECLLDARGMERANSQRREFALSDRPNHTRAAHWESARHVAQNARPGSFGGRCCGFFGVA
eukprot:14617761-Alexandrium_andersonii.AAC.1